MSIKLVVLYPRPIDEVVFEQLYHSQHIPLMRSLIDPPTRVRSYRIRAPAKAPFYRMAEVAFDSFAELEAFASSEEGKGARRSAQNLSTGGEPLILIGEEDSR